MKRAVLHVDPSGGAVSALLSDGDQRVGRARDSKVAAPLTSHSSTIVLSPQSSIDGSPQGFFPCDRRQIVDCQIFEIAICVAQRDAIHHRVAVADTTKARHGLKIAADHRLHFFLTGRL